jgi:hypothetical protein
MIELLTTDNYISFNIKAAQIFGLQGAVYCSELINIYNKATKKSKIIDDGYVKVDRKYITDRTTISSAEQNVIDLNWAKINLLKAKTDNPDIIKLDFDVLVSLLSSQDVTLLDDVRKKVIIKNPRGIKETRKQAICNNLKKGIDCSNPDLLAALRDWIDAIFSNPVGYLSKSSVDMFQDTLYNYTQGSVEKAIAIVKIATAQGYKDCQWAINVYEKSEQYKKKQQENQTAASARLPRVTEQKRATKNDISSDSF